MRENHRSAASCTPPTGDVPATKVHALDRNRTRDLSVYRPTLYPLSQTGFGPTDFLKRGGGGGVQRVGRGGNGDPVWNGLRSVYWCLSSKDIYFPSLFPPTDSFSYPNCKGRLGKPKQCLKHLSIRGLNIPIDRH